MSTTEHMDPTVALRLRRGKVTHREVPGNRTKTGPIIDVTGEPDWESLTSCGQRVPVIVASRLEVNVTCPACAEIAP